jgi:hypothetical protein
MQKFMTLENGSQKLIDAGVVTSAGESDTGKVPVLDNSGRLDTTMMPVGIGADTRVVSTSESLSAGSLVNIWNNFGTPAVRKADATVAGKEAHGFVMSSFTHPTTATVYFEGNNTAILGGIPGIAFLSTTPGTITANAPNMQGNIVQKVGIVTGPTSLNVEFGEPVELA